MSKKDIVDEIHKAARRNFPRRKTIIKGLDDLWQADLMDFQKYSNYNKGYKYILVVIDALSKYVWVKPVKSKDKNCVTKSMHDILSCSSRKPNNLQTDHGKEFYNNLFQKLLRNYDINHYSTHSVKKASIVERVIRTIKSHLYKLFSLNGSYRWLGPNLNSIVEKYNNTSHRITKHKPIEVNKANQIVVRSNILHTQRPAANRKPKFLVNDSVRVSKFKGDFYKGYTPNWSTEIFNVVKVNNTNPPTYILEDKHKQLILGSFYESEMQRTKFPDIYLIEKVIKRKGTKLFVKWLGLSNEENSWVDKKSLLS